MKLFVRLFVLTFILSSAACGPSGEEPSIRVLATIRPLALLAEDLLAGVERAEVRTLLSGAADPHNFALRVSDRKAIESSDLVLWIGDDLERFLVKPMAQRNPAEQLAMQSLPGMQWPQGTGHQHGHDQEASARDPHVWLSPDNARVMADAVAAKLVELVPGQAAVVQANLRNLHRELQAFKVETEKQLTPWSGEPFAVHHNALGHFVEAFDLNQVAWVTNSPEERLSARQLEELKRQVKDARCLLVEQSGPSAQRLAEALQLPVVSVDTLATSAQTANYRQMLESVQGSLLNCFSVGKAQTR